MSKQTTINDCRIIDLRKIHDPRGNLTPIEGGVDVPFDITKPKNMPNIAIRMDCSACALEHGSHFMRSDWPNG